MGGGTGTTDGGTGMTGGGIGTVTADVVVVCSVAGSVIGGWLIVCCEVAVEGSCWALVILTSGCGGAAIITIS